MRRHRFACSCYARFVQAALALARVPVELGERALAPGDRLAIGDAAVVEITALPHLGCRKFLARVGADALRWVNDKAIRGERRRGVHARVVEGGTVKVGDVARRLTAA